MFRLPITRTGFAIAIGLLAFCHHDGVSVVMVCIWRQRPYYDINHRGNTIGDIGETASGMSESSGRAGAPWALRALVVASVLLPLLVFAGGGWLAWRDTIRDANATLVSALAVSAEQATRVLDTHVLLGNRVNDLLGDLSDDAVIARERELHDRLAAMIAGYSQVTAIVVTGADGHALVANIALSRGSPHRFQRPRVFHRAARRRCAIPDRRRGAWPAVTRWTCSPSRSAAAIRKHFAGAILVGVSPSYFSKFDSDMFGGDPDYTAQHVARGRHAARRLS